jgi:hypothetical protein
LKKFHPLIHFFLCCIDIITLILSVLKYLGDAKPAGDRGEEETGGGPAKDTHGARLSQRLFSPATFSCRHHWDRRRHHWEEKKSAAKHGARDGHELDEEEDCRQGC